MRISCFYCDQYVSSELPEHAVFMGVAECAQCVDSLPAEGEKIVLWQARMIVDIFDKVDQEKLGPLEAEAEMLSRVNEIRKALAKNKDLGNKE